MKKWHSKCNRLYNEGSVAVLCSLLQSVVVCFSPMQSVYSTCLFQRRQWSVCCSLLQCEYPPCFPTVAVLQSIAVYCSLLQCVAVRCSTLQCVAVCCSVLQYIAVYCRVLQYATICCSVLQSVLQSVSVSFSVCCKVFQCVAVCTLDIFTNKGFHIHA